MRSLEVGNSGDGWLFWICIDPNIGVDQRKLFTAAKEWLPKINYRQVSWVNPELCGVSILIYA